MKEAIVSPEHIWIVDAFTTRAFLGNAAAVCVLAKFPDAEIMQTTALAMQLSETAFLVKKSPLEYDIRWFTPDTEVNLCGHATLAATHVLHQSGEAKPGDTVTYQSMSGPLSATVLQGGDIALDFPTLASEPAKAPAAMEALGVAITGCELSRDNYIVEVKDYATLISCMPNFKKLAKLDAQGVIVTTSQGIPVVDGKSFDFA
ncbi:MAG: PhzF family phenazine biosynthesis protein, partial [Proteobacteria bacterium]|nr:PhzF family phenazine biosynthesis protein [Pseudomonadota bacterium]